MNYSYSRFYEFLGWFISLLLWLPITIGWWFVHLDFLSTYNMLIVSGIISAIVAIYWVRSDHANLSV